MSKKRKSKKKKKTQTRKNLPRRFYSGENDQERIELVTYEITDEPIKDHSTPKKLLEELNSISLTIEESPGAVIDRLEELNRKYPRVPRVYNYLSLAYSILNDNEKSKYYAEKNYRENPDYLFAKLNYAEICMSEGNYKIIPEIFNHKFEIKALYPKREVFHVSEVVGFLGITGRYFLYADMKKQAELCYKMLKKLDPRHPYTKRLKPRLFKNVILGILSKVTRITKRL